jgi:Mannosylglycerate hydrolase MGH1-like glycoside hydrolase domain
MVQKTVDFVLENRRFLRSVLPSYVEPGHDGMRMLTIVSREALADLLRRVLDEQQFLSSFGIRSLSREHADKPYGFSVAGERYEVAYLPGESDNRIFGGNSNWRGPVWFPMNFLMIQAISTFARYYDDSFTIECPTGSGRIVTLKQVADELSHRLTRIFVRDQTGELAARRAVFGNNEFFQQDPQWRDYVPFYEFFHGETGAGLGASHQTGWTALVALMLQYRGQLSFSRPSKRESRPQTHRQDSVGRADMPVDISSALDQRGWAPASAEKGVLQ